MNANDHDLYGDDVIFEEVTKAVTEKKLLKKFNKGQTWYSNPKTALKRRISRPFLKEVVFFSIISYSNCCYNLKKIELT